MILADYKISENESTSSCHQSESAQRKCEQKSIFPANALLRIHITGGQWDCFACKVCKTHGCKALHCDKNQFCDKMTVST